MHHRLAVGGKLDVAFDGEVAAIGGLAAAGMFSTMPRAISCRPRCATGRAVSQSGTHAPYSGQDDLEDGLDLDRRIRGQ